MRPDQSIGVIQAWLGRMTPHGVEQVEDALVELRAHVSSLSSAEARELIPRLAQASALAAAAGLLWEAAAAFCGESSYSPSGAVRGTTGLEIEV